MLIGPAAAAVLANRALTAYRLYLSPVDKDNFEPQLPEIEDLLRAHMRKSVSDEIADIPLKLRTDMRVVGMLGIWFWTKKHWEMVMDAASLVAVVAIFLGPSWSRVPALLVIVATTVFKLYKKRCGGK